MGKYPVRYAVIPTNANTNVLFIKLFLSIKFIYYSHHTTKRCLNQQTTKRHARNRHAMIF